MSSIVSNDPEFIDAYEVTLIWRVMATGCGYSLSFLFGIALNGHIIRRLMSKDVKKTNYFRLLIVKCILDIYLSVFGMVAYTTVLYSYLKKKQTGKDIDVYEIISSYKKYFYTFPSELQRFLVFLVTIHWKTVVIKKPRMDKFLYISTSLLSFISMVFSIYPVTNITGTKSTETNTVMVQLATILSFPLYLHCLLVSIYCIQAVLRIKTDTYSPQTFKAYRRMALAHFIQSTLIELDYIGRAFLPLLWVIAFFIQFNSLATQRIQNPEKEAKLHEEYHKKIIDMFVVAFKGNIALELFQALQPCLYAIFMYWALRRLLRSAVKKVPVIQLKKSNSAEESLARRR